MKLALTKEDVTGLTDDQQRSIVAACAAAVLADGKIEATELTRFEQEITQVDWGKDKQTLRAWAKETTQQIVALKTKEAVLGFIDGIAAKITAQPLREKVLRMMVSIAAAGGDVTQGEKNIIGQFMAKFGVPEARLKEIVADLRG